MTVDFELWTRETGDLAPLLPRAGEWDASVDFFEFEGDGWLLSVAAPEKAPFSEVPEELRALSRDLHYRIDLGIEPGAPGREAWALARQTMESIGQALGGVGLDPESGRATSFSG